MSILKKALEARQAAAKEQGFVCAITGVRLVGKSTLAGTLPGRTLLLQPAGIEAGNKSPIVKAKKLNNVVDLIDFGSIKECAEMLSDPMIQEYDNIVFDGISAYSDLIYYSKEFAAASKKNKWDGFDLIKDEVTKVIVELKFIAETYNKNCFMTVALQYKYDAEGNIIETEPVAKGNFPKKFVEGHCPNVVCAVSFDDDEGAMQRKILTNNSGGFVARLGDLLDEDNPGLVDDSLADVLALVGR